MIQKLCVSLVGELRNANFVPCTFTSGQNALLSNSLLSNSFSICFVSFNTPPSQMVMKQWRI